MSRKIKNLISRIEKNRFINWKVILLLYLLTRIGIVMVLTFGTWNNSPLLCYTSDCNHWWNNALHVAEGRNPYEEWRKVGFLEASIPERCDYPPLIYLIISTFVIFWKNVWAVRLMFFLFDFFTLILIWNLAGKFKKIATLFYIFTPSILRGVFRPEDEFFVAFTLLSIYFLQRKNYSLSTFMLALSFNIKIFPILLFPLLLLNMGVLEKVKGQFLPKVKNFTRILKQTSLFIFISILLHLPYFPDWWMTYQFRTARYALAQMDRGLWAILPVELSKYYFIILAASFLLFYLYSYWKNLDVKANYLFSSLLFISFFPGFSPDHLIFIVPLFLIWTEFELRDLLLWLLFSVGAILEFLGLRTIGLITQYQRRLIMSLILIGFYITIIKKFLKNEK